MEFGKTLVNLPKSFRRSIRDNVKTKSKDGNGDDNLSKVTYEELVELRDNSKLIPGRKYRIIDFVTTVGEVIGIYTDSENVDHEYIKYASAKHPFDIVVTALDVDKLDEVASCLLHENDTYFSNINISAWEIKYCLDNDTNRFEWADPDGKGVIYYMKDDRNNECDYDFKNVLFWRCYVEDNYGDVHYIGLPDYIEGNSGVELPNINRNDFTYIYTFSIRGTLDASNNDFYNDASISFKESFYGLICKNNIIKSDRTNVIIDSLPYNGYTLPNITIVAVDNVYDVCNNIIQNSLDLVFIGFLINSSILNRVNSTYFLRFFKNLNISGYVNNTYFGYADDFHDFVEYNYVTNLNIKGKIIYCDIFNCDLNGYDTSACDITLDGYIEHSTITYIRNITINAYIKNSTIRDAVNTQFYGEYNNTAFIDIRNSYVNSTLNNVNFLTTLINSNVQGEFNGITFTPTKIPLQAIINLYAPLATGNVNITFKQIPSKQRAIVAEIVGMSITDLPAFTGYDVSLTPEDNVLVPKLSILINEDEASITRYQI